MAAAGADMIHFDVMDNHCVPHLTVGPLVCAALRPHVKLPLDVHLMVKPVDRLVAEGPEALMLELSGRLALRGARVRCADREGSIVGVAPSGALRLLTDHGLIELLAGRIEVL